MTSKERHQKRYERRKARREEKRLAILENNNFDKVASHESLYNAAIASRSGVYWKASVQRYQMNILRNVSKTHKELHAGKDVRRGFIEFDIFERGKHRHIQSVHYYERVVQKSLCTNALIPHLTRSLIYDNGASLKDKGLHFSLRRVKVHLSKHYRKHGTDGYVIVIDFKGYFSNIRHEPIRAIYERAFGEDKRLMELAMSFVTVFGDKGLGLGSEASQINALIYINSIDHYIKEVLRCKYYGRYMDDSYIICESKERAQEVLNALCLKYEEYGIIPHPRKTTIVKLTRGFTFLKTHFSITGTGKIITRPCRECAARQRRKLKKFKKFLDVGEMELENIRISYMSWRGSIAHKHARRTINNMDALYLRLFGEHPIKN